MTRLDAALLRRLLAEEHAAKLDELEVFASIASTNTHLLQQTPPPIGNMRVAIADHQTAGRGRHDRRWLSPPGAGLCLSMAYTFEEQPEQLPALTLAIGVGIVSGMRSLDIDGISLKWPNDIVALGGKLGGVLTEVHAQPDPGVTVVTGIGMNIELPDSLDLGGDSGWAQRPVDLRSVVTSYPEREAIAAALIHALFATMTTFGERGFAGFIDDWLEHDWLRERAIHVDQADGRIYGTAAGVDTDGALLIDTGEQRVRVISGSIVMTDDRGRTQ